jgi:hypothetical protein
MPLPALAPADAPVMMENGAALLAKAGISLIRFITSA